MNVLGRIFFVVLANLLLFECILQATVDSPESTEESWQLLLLVMLVGGLIWSVKPCFPSWKNSTSRWLARSACVVTLFVGTYSLTYFYSWHVRPNIGLYNEPAWVADHPAFQEQLRQRIESNRW